MPARIVNNRRGSTLILVILVFALLIIFATAALTLAESSHRNSVTDWQNQQAYFTARSAVLAAVDYFKDNPDEDIADYLGASDESHTADMGEYRVTIEKLDDTRYEISSEADFEGKKRTVRAIVSKTAGAAGYPFGQNIVTTTKLNNIESTMNGGLNIHGNVMINDKTPFDAGVNISGDLYVVGPISITGNPQLYTENGQGGNLYCTGDLTFQGSCTIQGNAYCKGNFTLSGGNMNFTGDSSVFYVGKKFTRADNGGAIQKPKDIFVWGDGDLHKYNWASITTISGILHLGGRLLNPPLMQYPPIVVENYNPENFGYEMPEMTYEEDISKLGDLVNIAEYEADIKAWKDKKILVQPPQWHASVTISENCTPVPGTNGGKLIVDTTKGDVKLYLDETNCNMFNQQQLSLFVKGPNKVIIYLGKGAVLKTSGGQNPFGVVGNNSSISKDATPQVYIVAPYEDNSIWLYQMAAFIIMPYGDVTIGGGGIFVGNMMVASSQMQGDAMYYKAPDYPDIGGVGEIGVPDGGAGGGSSSGGIDLLGIYTNKNS